MASFKYWWALPSSRKREVDSEGQLLKTIFVCQDPEWHDLCVDENCLSQERERKTVEDNFWKSITEEWSFFCIICPSFSSLTIEKQSTLSHPQLCPVLLPDPKVVPLFQWEYSLAMACWHHLHQSLDCKSWLWLQIDYHLMVVDLAELPSSSSW